MPPVPVRPQYILGTEAFYAAFADTASPAHAWLFNLDKRSVYQRGIIVSCITPLVCGRTLANKLLRDPTFQPTYQKYYTAFAGLTRIFYNAGCIWGIGHHHLLYAEDYLKGNLQYTRQDRSSQTIGDFEKWVLATAILGFNNQPIVLCDYQQQVHSQIPNLHFQKF